VYVFQVIRTCQVDPFSSRVRCESALHTRGLFITRGHVQADRTEPYTKIEPFQETVDTSVECAPQLKQLYGRLMTAFPFRFFFRPLTLTALSLAFAALAYVATTQDVLEEGRDKRRMYVLALYASTPSKH